MNEFDIIRQYFKRPARSSRVKLSVGDDCAILNLPRGRECAISTDTLVEGRHYHPQAPAQLIAERSLSVAISDLAAMGAKPFAATLALSLSSASEEWLDRFSQGLYKAADLYDCDIVGGDLTKGQGTITLTVMGEVDEDKALKRSGAKEGDLVFVSGFLGDAAAALRLLNTSHGVAKDAHVQAWADDIHQAEIGLANARACNASEWQNLCGNRSSDDVNRAQDFNYLLSRFYCPSARVQCGIGLTDIASAAIDISDGLVADIEHICEQSRVAMKIDVDAIPVSVAARRCFPDAALHNALYGGDDYELCFTVAPEREAKVDALASEQNVNLHKIGRVVSPSAVHDSPIQLTQGGSKIVPVADSKGYVHFE